MPLSQYERVSAFKEDTMVEVDSPKLTPRSSYSTGLEKTAVKEPTFNYKPLILRTAPLLALLALTLGLIGLLQYAIMQLPHGTLHLKKRDESPAQAWGVDLEDIRRRAANTVAGGVSNNSSSSSAEPTYYTTDDSAYVDGVSTSTSSTVLAYTSDTSAYLDDSSTSLIVAPSTPRSAYVDPKSTSTGEGAVSAFSADTSAYVPDHSTSVVTRSVQLDTAQSAYVQDPTDSMTHHGLLRPTLPPSAYSSATSAYVPGVSTQLPGTRPNGGNGDGNGQHGGGNDDGDGPNDGDSEFQNQNAAVDDDGPTKAVLVNVWNPAQVFLGNYLAVCIAVVYRLFWIVLYNAFNLLDPFRQLMSREGATAEGAFFAFYQNQSNLLGPIPALVRRRWALALVATAYFIINVLPALAAESVYTDTQWDCENPSDNTNNPCNPRATANVTILRVMQGLLGFGALVILFMTSLLLFNKTGLPTRPNSIAAVAALMRHPRLLADLNDMPVNASTEHMQQLMAGKRYRMGHYTCANGLTGYGIQPFHGYDGDGYGSTFGSQKHQYTPVDGALPFSSSGEESRASRFQVKDFVLAFFLLGAFGVVLAYYLDGNKDGFNDFFNSNTFGPRFILTLAGTVIASIWKSVEQDAVVTAPFIRLHSRPSSPRSTISLATTSTPLTSTLRTLRHRYYLTSTITLLTLGAEGLNVVISGVPYASGQRHFQFIISTYISLAILGLMIIVTAVMIPVKFLWEPGMPRRPTTLGAVMSYLCGSRMLDDFEGMEGLDEKAREQRIRNWGKRYEFSETVRRDGKLAWTVDEALDRPSYWRT